MRPKRILQVALVGLSTVGCTSVKSTHVERAKELCGWKTQKLHGIPTTLEVPHHYKVSVLETYYEKNGNVLRDTGCKVEGNVLPPILRTHRVEVLVENTKEIFTVDFVRPAAGTLTTKATLDAERQYFTGIKNGIDDTTIKEVTAAIGTLSATINPLLRSGAGITDPDVIKHDRVLAVTFVEVADPEALVKIHEFLCQHLNSCNGCSSAAPAAVMKMPVQVTKAPAAGPRAPVHVQVPVAPPLPANVQALPAAPTPTGFPVTVPSVMPTGSE